MYFIDSLKDAVVYMYTRSEINSGKANLLNPTNVLESVDMVDRCGFQVFL